MFFEVSPVLNPTIGEDSLGASLSTDHTRTSLDTPPVREERLKSHSTIQSLLGLLSHEELDREQLTLPKSLPAVFIDPIHLNLFLIREQQDAHAVAALQLPWQELSRGLHRNFGLSWHPAQRDWDMANQVLFVGLYDGCVLPFIFRKVIIS